MLGLKKISFMFILVEKPPPDLKLNYFTITSDHQSTLDSSPCPLNSVDEPWDERVAKPESGRGELVGDPGVKVVSVLAGVALGQRPQVEARHELIAC